MKRRRLVAALASLVRRAASLVRRAACLCLIAAPGYCGEEMKALKTVTDKPEITEDILLNPGMGLFIMPGLKGDYDKEWWMPIVSVAYFREDWAALEPEEGRYEFDAAFGPAFDYWLSRGYRVAFRPMSSNMHSRREFVSPKWLFDAARPPDGLADAGVPGVEHKGLYVPRQIDPPFWHPTYIEKQAAFIAALGKRYNGMKGLEFVDLGAVGEWGESHLMRWSSEDLEKTGYTPTAYTKAYMRFIDLYRQAFPDTPLALNCATGGAGHNDVIVDYAVSKGIWLRQDGLVPDYGRGGASRYYHQYFTRVKTLYELCHGYQGMAERGMTAMDTFKRGLEDPISYLNLMGAGEVSNLPETDRDACRLAARHVGYRLAPLAVERPAAIHIDDKVASRTWFRITWRNLGAAPCYENLAVELALVSEKGETLHRMVEMPEKPTTLWMPREDVVTYFSFPLGKPRPWHRQEPGQERGKALSAGKYLVKVGLVDPFDETRRILLPLKDKDDRGRYTISAISAERRAEPLPQPQITGSDFASKKALEGWWFPKGITASVVNEAPGGKPCLRVAGTTRRVAGKTGHGWNYAGAPSIPLLPATEYELSAMMNVIAIDDPKKQPYVKMGLVDAEGKFFTNKTTSRYDTSKLGTWQELRGRFITEAKTGGGTFAIEKGDTLPREATILLDAVRLEIISAP